MSPAIAAFVLIASRVLQKIRAAEDDQTSALEGTCGRRTPPLVLADDFKINWDLQSLDSRYMNSQAVARDDPTSVVSACG